MIKQLWRFGQNSQQQHGRATLSNRLPFHVSQPTQKPAPLNKQLKFRQQILSIFQEMYIHVAYAVRRPTTVANLFLVLNISSLWGETRDCEIHPVGLLKMRKDQFGQDN